MVGWVLFIILWIKFVLNFGILSIFVGVLICFFVIFKIFVLENNFIMFGLFGRIFDGLIFDKFWSLWIIVGLLCFRIFNFKIFLLILWKLKWVVC